MKNYYEILEVNRLASPEIINKAYRVLAQKYHPDKYEGKAKIFCENKMQEINEAYEILSNEFLKEQYDTELEKEEILKYHDELKSQPKDSKIQEQETQKVIDVDRTYKVGTFSAVTELAKQVYENRPHIEGAPSKKGIFAVAITIIVLIIIGIILWFIPFTNSWIRELTVENPLFSWIGEIFKSK